MMGYIVMGEDRDDGTALWATGRRGLVAATSVRAFATVWPDPTEAWAAAGIMWQWCRDVAVYHVTPDGDVRLPSYEDALRALKSHRIVVTRRAADYHATIDGTDGRKWGAGATPDEAIGAVVRCHADALGIEVVLPGGGT